MLWRIWQATNLEQRWTDAAALGGPVGAAADRDLDAVLALFDSAARHADRLPGADVSAFVEYLADQQLPGDTLAARAPDADAVALLTAHAARGREWRVVAVPGVQEGAWPDLRLRGSLLGNERLVDLVAGVAEHRPPRCRGSRRCSPRSAGCSTSRAPAPGDTLLVSAVQAASDEQPSRFLDELDPAPDDGRDRADRPVHRPGRALVLAELVGELRRAVCSPDEPARPGRAGAARRPPPPGGRAAGPAGRGRGSRRRARTTGTALAPLSTDAPLRAPGEVVPVSPSDVEKILRCPLRWMLERHGGGEVGALSAVTGTLVHALVQAGAAGADGAELEGALRAAWQRLDLGAPWFGRRELARVRGDARGVRRLGAPQPGRRACGSSRSSTPCSSTCRIRRGRGAARCRPVLRLRGRVDRLEVDAAGRPVVVDVKTGRTAATRPRRRRAPAARASTSSRPRSARSPSWSAPSRTRAAPGWSTSPTGRRRGEAKVPEQPPLDAAELERWKQLVRTCAEETAGARFHARVGPDCDRCPVRASCPVNESGRSVTDG